MGEVMFEVIINEYSVYVFTMKVFSFPFCSNFLFESVKVIGVFSLSI